MGFLECVKDAAEEFKEIDTPVRIVSHLDADGLTSASILMSVLKRKDVRFSLSIVKQLSVDVLNQLKRENYENFFFLDVGSGNLEDIKNVLSDKKVFIFDHHHVQDIETDFVHVNPRIFGLDGDKEISGAGVVYFFSKFLDKDSEELAHLAVIGAVGDNQEKEGFLGLNKEILNDALQNKVEVKIGLRMFGAQTKPLYKVLQYSIDPYIPGVTGDKRASIGFLEELNLDKDKKLVQLTEEEMKNLVTGIVLRRMGSEAKPEDVLGEIYLLKEEAEESPTRDAREFATLLNSCGRLERSSLGIGTCLNDNKIKKKAIDLLGEYRKEIIKALNWFYVNKGSDYVIEKDGLVIINAEDNIRSTMIGTIASMVSKSNIYPENTIILSLSHMDDKDTKISIRVCGSSDLDLKNLLSKIGERFDISVGGHKCAAGSVISQEREKEFVEVAQQVVLKEGFVKIIG